MQPLKTITYYTWSKSGNQTIAVAGDTVTIAANQADDLVYTRKAVYQGQPLPSAETHSLDDVPANCCDSSADVFASNAAFEAAGGAAAHKNRMVTIGGVAGWCNGATVQAVGGSLRTSPVRIVTFGDSTANLNDWNGSPNANTDMDCELFVGNAAAAKNSIQATSKYTLSQQYPMAFHVRNCGVSGETTTQMLARDSAAASATRRAATDIMSASADVVIYRGGSINDINTLTAVQITPAVIADVITRHMTNLQRLGSGGAYVIDNGILGYSPATSADVVARQAAVVQINNGIAAAITALNNGNIIFKSPTGIVSDETGAFYSGMSNDGTHLNSYGAIILDTPILPLIRGRFGESSGVRYAGTNLATNQMLVALDALQAWGTRATGFAPGVVNGTRQNGKVEVVDGYICQTVEYVPSGAGAMAATIYMPFAVADLVGHLSGDIYGVEFYYKVSMANGSAVPAPTLLTSRFEIKQSTFNNVCELVPESGRYPTLSKAGGFFGKSVLNPIQINDAAVNLTLPAISLQVTINATDSVAANVLKLAAGGLRIVRLNR